MGFYGYFVYPAKRPLKAHDPAVHGAGTMIVTAPNRQQRRAILAGKGPKPLPEPVVVISKART